MKLLARKTAIAFAVMSALALGLGACGRKGPLEPHPDAPPAPKAAEPAEAQSATRPSLGGSRRTLSSPIAPPAKPFILDPLL